MAQLTSAEAAKLLRQLNEDLNLVLEKEEMSKSFLATIGEDPETVRPEYKFLETNKQIEELQTRIRLLKHAISVFNTTTVLPEINITIDQALVYIPQLSQRCNKLRDMKSKLPKTREAQGFGRNTTNFVDYRYINYDIDEVAKEYDKCKAQLDMAQLQLDYVNSTVQFTVDDSVIS